MTRAPGDPDSDTPEWVCITGQRINVFRYEEYDGRQVRTPEKLLPIVPTGVDGYISIREASRIYSITSKAVRMVYKRHFVRTIKQGRRIIINAEDFAKARGKA